VHPIPFSYSRRLDRLRALWDDARTLYLRARYGWAPRDVWSLDHYLNRVLAGALERLANTTHGTPVGYPYQVPHIRDGESMRPYRDHDDPNDVITDHAVWQADLRRWAIVFREAADDSDIFQDGSPFATSESQLVEMQRRSDAVRQALAEITPWWEALWD
jgi:hypothetical protein